MISDEVLRLIIYIIGLEIIAILFIVLFIAMDVWKSIIKLQKTISSVENTLEDVQSNLIKLASLSAVIPAIVATWNQFFGSSQVKDEADSPPGKRTRKVI
jgi:hypothetical protein